MTPDYLQTAVLSTARRKAASVAGRRGVHMSAGVIWAAVDFLSAVMAGVLAVYVRSTASGRPLAMVLRTNLHTNVLVSLGYVALFGFYVVLCTRWYGLYRDEVNRSILNEQRLTVQANLAAGLLLCGTLYMVRGYAVSRLVVALTLLLAMSTMMVRRWAVRKLLQKRYLEGLETRNVMIVGTGRVAHALRNHLEALPHLGFRFMGFVSLDEGEEEAGVVGSLKNCVVVARSRFVDEIYVSTPMEKAAILTLLEEARVAGMDVRVVPDLYDGLAWNAPVEYIGQFPTIPLHMREFPLGAYMVKRAIDLVLSSLGIVVFSPLMLVVALAVRLSSPGPVLYRSERIGRRGRIFTFLKFRTMVDGAETMRSQLMEQNERDGVLFKIENDPRVTPVGRMLRRYSLDELPQLFNVFLGQMSLVGPRPPLAGEVEQYDAEHMRRLTVSPGMTGLWQVEARQDPSFDSYISLDTAYVENWNLLLDFRIMARTVGVVLSGTGR